MNIAVRVSSAAARAQIAALQKQVAMLEAELAAATKVGAAGAGSSFMAQTVKNASRMQWVGRQIQTNFTYPLIIAGGFATKFALDNEKAMVRVKKVYGDGSQAFRQLSRTEIPALQKAFEALSNEFGVNQAAVINIAGDWAAAGASGVALARGVKLTLQTMVLGEMDAVEATRALIAIQAQYGFSTKQLAQTIDTLNMVENQTGVSMSGLVQGFERAAGTARSAGIDVRHLAAMIAAISPAAGTAAQAGNGLKTIISRLLSPTKDAADVLKLMHIQISETTWKSLNGAQRLEVLAKRYAELGKGVQSHTKVLDKDGKATGKYLSAQQAVVSSVIASRYQINRFDVLMRELTSNTGYYAKALNSTNSAQKNFNQKQFELNQVLSSNPQRLKQIWVVMQNAMADVITPMIPALVYLAQQVAKMFNEFSRLPGPIQKFAVIAAILLALVGPVTRYFYAWVVLFELLGKSFGRMSKVFAAGGRLLTSPFRLLGQALSGTYGLVYKFFAGIVTLSGNAYRAIMARTAAFVSLQKLAWVGGTIVNAVKALWAAMVSIFTAGGAAVTSIATGTAAATTAAEVAGAAARTAATQAGALARLAGETAEQTGRSVAVRTGTLARVASEAQAMETIWTITQIFHVNQVASEAAAQAEMLAITDGGAAARLAIESKAATQRLIAVDSAGVAVVISEGTAYLARLNALVGFVGGTSAIYAAWVNYILALIAELQSGILAIEAGGSASRLAITEGGAAARLAIEVGAAAQETAIEVRKQASLVAAGTAGGEARVVAEAGTQSRLMALMTAGAARMAAIPLLAVAGWAVAIGAILALAYHFRDQIGKTFEAVKSWIAGDASQINDIFISIRDTILNAFWSLPAGVRSAIIAVVNVIRAAALAIYDWFSYINPWAHHSPSLVESVTSGMNEVSRQMARAKGIGSLFATVARDLANFKKVAAGLGKGPFADERTDVAKNYRSLLPLFDKLVDDWKRLTALANQQEAAMNRQQAVVDKWAAALDKANKALDTQQKKLDDLQKALDSLNAEYQSHQDALNNFASAPLVGMREMEDQIFANDQAQKALRLEMLKWEDVNGSIDDVRNNYEKLQGDIEMLRGEQASLRAAGAGSDITGPMQAQIDAMQAQSDAMQQTLQNGPMAEWQKQLDALQHQAEELDLEQSLQFDPLTRQIQQLVDTTKELTFQEIVDGIKNEQAAMAALQPQIDDYTAQVAAQQAVVDELTKKRDLLQATYDMENQKLQQLTDNYNKTKDAIGQVEDALRSMGEAARQAGDAAAKGGKAGSGASNFAGAAGGKFPDVGGVGNIGREGGLGDQSKLIDQFTQDTAAELGKTFGSFDMLGPLKKKWTQAWGWVKENVGPTVSGVTGAISDAWSHLSLGGGDTPGWVKSLGSIWSTIVDMGKSASYAIQQLLAALKPDFERTFHAIIKAGKEIWKDIGPELEKFGPVLKDLGPAFKNIWFIVKLVAGLFGVVLLAAIKVVAGVFSKTLWPVLHAVINIIGDLIQVVRGLVEIVVGLASGDWKMAWQGIKDTVSGTFQAIWHLIEGVGHTIVAIVKGIVIGIVEFFKWLWDVLVGHSIVPDIVNGIIYFFQLLIVIPQWIWNNVLKPVYDFFVKVWNNYIKPFLGRWWEGIKAEWSALKTLGAWVWNNVLKPVYDKFSDAFSKVKNIVGDAKDKISSAFDSMRNKANDFVSAIKSIPGKIKDMASDFKEAGSKIIGQLWQGMKNAGSIISDLAGDIWNAVKAKLNAGIRAVNDKIPDSIGKGPFKIDLPNNPFPEFYKGGIIKGSRKGTAIIAGDRGHDEAIVPLSGPYAPKYDRNLPGGMGSHGGGDKTYNFYGDLSFPNVTSGNDAESFISNLEILSKD